MVMVISRWVGGWECKEVKPSSLKQYTQGAPLHNMQPTSPLRPAGSSKACWLLSSHISKPSRWKTFKFQLSCMSHKVIWACTKVPVETAMELSPDDELLWTWWHSSNDSWTKRKEGTLCRIALKPKGRHNGIHICPFLSLPLSVQAATTARLKSFKIN